MKDQKTLIQIINKLRKGCRYDTVLKMETAKAELSQDFSQQKYSLPLKPN